MVDCSVGRSLYSCSGSSSHPPRRRDHNRFCLLPRPNGLCDISSLLSVGLLKAPLAMAPTLKHQQDHHHLTDARDACHDCSSSE